MISHTRQKKDNAGIFFFIGVIVLIGILYLLNRGLGSFKEDNVEYAASLDCWEPTEVFLISHYGDYSRTSLGYYPDRKKMYVVDRTFIGNGSGLTRNENNTVYNFEVSCSNYIHSIQYIEFDDNLLKYPDLIMLELNTTDTYKKDMFFAKNKDFYVVDSLTKHYDTEGDITGTANGDAEGYANGYTTGLFNTGSIHQDIKLNIDLDINANIKTITTEEYPKKVVREEQFLTLIKKYDVAAVKCIITTLGVQLVSDNPEKPYLVTCAFERENIQFISTLSSITSNKKLCVDKVELQYYLTDDDLFTVDKFTLQREIPHGTCKEIYGEN